MSKKFLPLLYLFCAVNTINAEIQYSLVRHGSPKYDKDFKNFNYVVSDAPKGGKIKLATVGTFDSVNPFIAKGIAAEGSAGVLFDTLMKRSADEPFSLYPLIAEKVDLAKDNSSITYFINPKAKFNDGSSITAEDVVFSFNLLKEKGLPRYKQYFSLIEKFEIIDPLKVKLTFKEKEKGKGFDPEIPMITALLKVFPKKAMEKIDFANSGLTIIPASGPYKIHNIEQGRKVVYERNPYYWAKDLPVNKGQYNYDLIQIDYYKNAESQFQAFTGSEFDVYFATDFVTWQRLEKIPAAKDGHLIPVQTTHNRPVPVRGFIMNLRKPVFQDIRVRKALLMAFDGDTINKMLFQNSFKRPNSLFANTHLSPQGPALGYEKQLLDQFKSELNPEIYKAPLSLPTTDGSGNQRENLIIADNLLKEAGWTIDKFGKRVNEKGEHFVINFILKEPKWEKIILSFQRSLKQLGIDLKLNLIDATQYENRVLEFDYEMLTHTWANSLSPGNEQIYYYSASNAMVKGSGNYMGMVDPVVEALAHKVAQAKTNEELVGAARAMDRVICHKIYMIPLSYDNTINWAYWKNRLEMPKMDPLAGFNVLEWGWQPTNLENSSSQSNSFLNKVILKIKNFFK